MLECNPVIGIIGFHVKQAPIEESPPGLRRPIDQFKAVGIDDINRRLPNQIGATFYRLAIDMNFQSLGILGNAGSVTMKPTKQQKSAFIPIDALSQLVGSEGLRLTEHENCLEQTGFARAIATTNQIHSRIEIECGTPEISEIRQTQLTDRHDRFGRA